MVTLKWLDLKTLQQQTLCQQTLETWQMQNLSVLTSVSKLHPIRAFKPRSWYLFFFCFSIARFFFLHYTLFICMYLCNLFLSFGRVFLKKNLLQVKDLTDQFPAATPLALVLKQFLADRTLDQSYSGGLSSYCLVRRILLLK